MEGRLDVTGSIVSAVTVQYGGVLGGTGQTGAVSVLDGGRLAPGASPGLLHTGNLTLADGSFFGAEVQVTGTVSIGDVAIFYLLSSRL